MANVLQIQVADQQSGSGKDSYELCNKDQCPSQRVAARPAPAAFDADCDEAEAKSDVVREHPEKLVQLLSPTLDTLVAEPPFQHHRSCPYYKEGCKYEEDRAPWQVLDAAEDLVCIVPHQSEPGNEAPRGRIVSTEIHQDRIYAAWGARTTLAPVPTRSPVIDPQIHRQGERAAEIAVSDMQKEQIATHRGFSHFLFPNSNDPLRKPNYAPTFDIDIPAMCLYLAPMKQRHELCLNEFLVRF
ncbi:hypothetical protein LTR49_022386 [Elasticomyces elasticus]|nr:hypothetical protein LTR49_022386 [Elasticomyces elasticus]